MTTLEIILLIIGVAFIIGSFFITEKLSSTDVDNLKTLSREQIEDIIKDKMADAKSDMEDVLANAIDEAMDNLEVKTDKETNEKIMHISEYSDTVLESINQSHNEVMFMYSMLNEKQEEITSLSRELTELKDLITSLDASTSLKIQDLKELDEKSANDTNTAQMSAAAVTPTFVPIIPAQEISIKDEGEEPYQEVPSFTEQLVTHYESVPTPSNNNIEILELHDKGLSEVEIAKRLGRGLGEVKFVLGLYQED